jgi:hypothetical protein
MSMKSKTYDPEQSIIAARVALSAQESVSDPAMLRAAGAAMFHAATVGEEVEILRGMLGAAEDAGSEHIARALRKALGQRNDVLVDPNDATELIRMLDRYDGVVAGKDASLLGKVAYETIGGMNGRRRVFVAMLEAAKREGDEPEVVRALSAAIAVLDGALPRGRSPEEMRAEEIDLLAALRTTATEEGVEAVVGALDRAIDLLRRPRKA